MPSGEAELELKDIATSDALHHDIIGLPATRHFSDFTMIISITPHQNGAIASEPNAHDASAYTATRLPAFNLPIHFRAKISPLFARVISRVFDMQLTQLRA